VNLIPRPIQSIVVRLAFIAIERRHGKRDRRRVARDPLIQEANLGSKANEDVNHSTAEKLPLFLRVSPHYSAL